MTSSQSNVFARAAGFIEGNAIWLVWPLVVLGFALRLRESIHTPLWFEEIYIAMVSRLPVPQLIQTLGHDIHPPFGYLVEHGWLSAFGMSALMLKMLPLMFSLLIIQGTFELARRLVGGTAALFATLLVVFSHGHIRVTQEAQAFALEGAMLLLTLVSALNWIKSRRVRYAVFYIVFAACAAYTHYVSLAFLLVLGVWGAIDLRHDRAWLWKWIGLHAIIAAIFAPQFPVLVSQFIQEGAAHHGHFPYRSDWLTLGRAIAIGRTSMIPVFVILGALPLLDPAKRRIASLLWALVILPLFSLRLWSLNFPRETLWVMPLFVPLVAAGLLALPSRWLRWSAAIALLALSARGDLVTPGFPEPVMLGRARVEMSHAVRPGDLIVHSETHSLLFFRFYDPSHDHRIEWPAGSDIPYYEGGLMVPPEWKISPEEWAAVRARGERWWAVALNRAQINQAGGFKRTGVRVDSIAASVAGARSWDLAPVRLWASPSVAAP